MFPEISKQPNSHNKQDRMPPIDKTTVWKDRAHTRGCNIFWKIKGVLEQEHKGKERLATWNRWYNINDRLWVIGTL